MQVRKQHAHFPDDAARAERTFTYGERSTIHARAHGRNAYAGNATSVAPSCEARIAIATQQKAPIYVSQDVWDEVDDMSDVLRKMEEEGLKPDPEAESTEEE